MRLEWSPLAMADRDAIFDYIEADDPRAAIAVDERIDDAAAQLIDFPQSGRIGRVDGTRELRAARTPYVLPYVVAGDVVRILRVIHGAQRWPEDFAGDDSV